MTWKKAGLLLVVLVLSIVFRLPVQAQEQRFSQTASATVTLHLTGTDQLPEANRDFRLIPMDSDIILEQSAEAAAAQARQLDAAWFENQDGNPEIRPSQTTQETVVFQGVEPGIYLVSEGQPGNYRPYEPVLIQVEQNTDLNMAVKRFLPTIVIQKTDEQGNSITNKPFAFGIFSDADCQDKVKSLPAELTKGQVSCIFDRYQTLYIKETKAPDGYRLSDQTVKVEFSEQGVFADGLKLSPSDGYARFEISYVNQPEADSPEKPKTPAKPNTSADFGVKGLSILAGLALSGLFGLVLLGRNEKEEK